jgi:hypothetical protein
MYKLSIQIILSKWNQHTNTKQFFSLNEKNFELLSETFEDNKSGINDLVDSVIYKYTSLSHNYKSYHNLIKLSKIDDIIYATYAIIVPEDTTATNCFLVNYNIAIINPIIRKAINYV